MAKRDELELARKRRLARGPGKPTKLTPERHAKICMLLRAGNYFKTACEVACVDPALAYEWIRRGEGRQAGVEPTEPYITFAREVRQAEGEAEAHKIAMISIASMVHWQAAAWWLERTRPEKYGRRERLTAEVDIRAEVEHHPAPARDGQRLLELVLLARTYGIVKDDDVIEGAAT